MTIVDTVFKALAEAIPHRVIAGHHADLLAAQFHGVNPKTSEFFIGNFGPLGGGWGAKHNEDGVSGTVCINDGDTHNSPNEQVEAKFPVVVERYGLVPDSGGAGRRRGGLGVERVVRARSNIVFNSRIERAHCAPWGLHRGATGPAIRSRSGSRAAGRPISRTRKCLLRRSRPAMLSGCARAVATATALPWNGRSRRSATTRSRVTSQSRRQRAITAS